MATRQNNFKLSINQTDLLNFTIKQINNSFPDSQPIKFDDLMTVFPEALSRLEHCFSHIDNVYFFDGESSIFNHLNGDQYAMWLYLLSNELFLQGASKEICSKVFLLNKKLHACDIFYEVELPSIFLLVHPLGTVLGRGNYSDFFVAYQRCGIGSNHNTFPSLGKHVTMRPGSAILGKSNIGDNCQLASETLIIDSNIPKNNIIFGNPSNQKLKLNKEKYPLWRVN